MDGFHASVLRIQETYPPSTDSENVLTTRLPIYTSRIGLRSMMTSKRNRSDVSTRFLSSELAMLADDLAGACDTGIEFLPAVERVTVILDSDGPGVDRSPQDGLQVWNTESRSLSPAAAYRKVRRACRRAVHPGTRVVVKKTDSAFRGPFGREIAAVMDELQLPLCSVVPAIPAFGRVTRHGVQYIDGVPIAESFYRHDPKHPVTESQVAHIVAAGVSRRIGVFPLELVRSPEAPQRLEQLLAAGVQILVVDGESQADVERSVTLLLQRPGQLLFVGGQGLGNALTTHCLPTAAQSPWTPVPQGGIVAVCGTLHPQTRKQIQFAARQYGVDPAVLQVDTDGQLLGREADAEDAAIWVLRQLERCGVAFLASPETPVADPSRVEATLAQAIEKIHERVPLSALILTGGATAYTVCSRLGITQLELRQRIRSGVVLTQVPELSGMAIGMKGGSLGDLDAVSTMIGAIQALPRRSRSNS
jgi:uncharacterized protein YgbK (DUF1537 family)